MYHSITFGDKNTWDDWHLIPSSRPLFNPPTVKTKTIDIPGGNGVIDLSESLTGYPVFNNREGSIEFVIVDQDTSWVDIFSMISNYLHGRRMKAILEDDPGHYYEGRFSVNSWKSDKDWSKITIDYSVGPYKWELQSSLDDWLWDTFSFVNGVIPTNFFKNLKVTHGQNKYSFDGSLFGSAITCPEFVISTKMGTGVVIRFVNSDLGIDTTQTLIDGTKQSSDMILNGGNIDIYVECNVPSSLYDNLTDSSGNTILDSTNENILCGNTSVANYTGTISIGFRKGEL
jgi:hypothetical protein